MTVCGKVIVGAAAIGVLLVASACDGGSDTPVATEEATRYPPGVTVTWNMERVEDRDGVRTGTLRADTVIQFEEADSSYLYGLTFVLYAEETGLERARVTADSGVSYARTNRLVARGDVVVRMSDGRRILSEELYYDPGRDEIRSDTATTLVEVDGRETYGSCFTSDLQFQNWDLCDPRGDVIGVEPDAEGGGEGGDARPDSAGDAGVERPPGTDGRPGSRERPAGADRRPVAEGRR